MDEEFREVYNNAINNVLFELFLPEDKNFITKTRSFLEEIKAIDKKLEISDKLSKNIYFISSELIQAVVHNGFFSHELFTNTIKVCHYENIFYLISQNLALNNKIERINSKFMEVNSCFDAADSKEEIQMRYKYKLKNTPMTKRGVSVGVLDLARRSMNKLLYNFEKLNDEYSIFTIICTVEND
jgi:hypothetical protein